VAARSTAWVCGRLLAGTAGSNPAKDMTVSCECCVLSGRGLCDGLITRTEESYRLWCAAGRRLKQCSILFSAARHWLVSAIMSLGTCLSNQKTSTALVRDLCLFIRRHMVTESVLIEIFWGCTIRLRL